MLSLLASFSSVMVTIGYVLLAILVLMVMITIHEFGHYSLGKLFKFKINEFSIGFGKAIFKKTLKSGEIFSIRIIPLGGYCAFAGEDEDDADPNAFNNKEPWKRIIVQLGGVLFNFLSAIVFAFILLVGFGYDVPKVSEVKADYQSETVLNVGDVIRKIDGKNVDFITDNTANNLLNQHYSNMTEEQKANYESVIINEKTYKKYTDLALTVQRGDATEEILVNFYVQTTTDASGKTQESLLVGFATVPYQHTFIEGLARCVPLAAAFAWKVLVFLWQLLTGAIGIENVGGPFTTISTIAEYTQSNFANLFIFLPFIAANLAIFNVLPLPALDGSRILFTTIEWIRGKPINRKIEGYIHFVGLIILFALVIFVDIYHLFI